MWLVNYVAEEKHFELFFIGLAGFLWTKSSIQDVHSSNSQIQSVQKIAQNLLFHSKATRSLHDASLKTPVFLAKAPKCLILLRAGTLVGSNRALDSLLLTLWAQWSDWEYCPTFRAWKSADSDERPFYSKTMVEDHIVKSFYLKYFLLNFADTPRFPILTQLLDSFL